MSIHMKIITKDNFFNIQTITTSGIILICIFLFAVFPTQGIFQEIIISLIFLLIIPIIYIKLILKKSLADFGVKPFTYRKWKENWFMITILFAVMILIFYFIAQYADFSNEHFAKKIISGKNFWYWLFYELVVVNFFIILYEFFFRGFIMFYFLKGFHFYSIFIQFLLFLLFLDLTNFLNLDAIGYIIVTLPAGIIAYKSKSLAYSYLFSIISIIIGDVIFIKLLS